MASLLAVLAMATVVPEPRVVLARISDWVRLLPDAVAASDELSSDALLPVTVPVVTEISEPVTTALTVAGFAATSGVVVPATPVFA